MGAIQGSLPPPSQKERGYPKAAATITFLIVETGEVAADAAAALIYVGSVYSTRFQLSINLV